MKQPSNYQTDGSHSSTNADISFDIIIIGGGVAGLWALNRLRQMGYQAILLESKALGSGQTIKSQGIIHGGIKYALTGFLNNSANAVEAMPGRWKDCLSGKGELDLQSVKLLSSFQLLWSTGSLGSDIMSFFGAKALNSRVQKLKPNEFPSILQTPAFKGHVFRLEEVVLDTESLVTQLAAPYKDYIFKINDVNNGDSGNSGNSGNKSIKLLLDQERKNIEAIQIYSGSSNLTLKAKRYLFTAGEGNEHLTANFSEPVKMQRRPLQMVYVKLKENHPFFAHCIDGGINPRITITTHPAKEGKTVWYLGGQVAEDGVHRTQPEQFIAAEKELNKLFPWLSLQDAEWGSFFINRAEPAQPGGKRPETDFVQALGNSLIAWPTKLALSPHLSDNIIRLLNEQGVIPSNFSDNQEMRDFLNILNKLEKPTIATPPWI